MMVPRNNNLSTIEALLIAYVDLNRVSAQPGDRSHMLAYSIQFLERMIKQELKNGQSHTGS